MKTMKMIFLLPVVFFICFLPVPDTIVDPFLKNVAIGIPEPMGDDPPFDCDCCLNVEASREKATQFVEAVRMFSNLLEAAPSQDARAYYYIMAGYSDGAVGKVLKQLGEARSKTCERAGVQALADEVTVARNQALTSLEQAGHRFGLPGLYSPGWLTQRLGYQRFGRLESKAISDLLAQAYLHGEGDLWAGQFLSELGSLKERIEIGFVLEMSAALLDCSKPDDVRFSRLVSAVMSDYASATIKRMHTRSLDIAINITQPIVRNAAIGQLRAFEHLLCPYVSGVVIACQ